MSGPWEQYQTNAPAAGPWSAYQADQDETKKQKGGLSQTLGNLFAGGVRGAGSIGATILTPFDAAARSVGIENSFIGRRDRREAMDQALQSMGADTDSLAYKGGKFGAEIAGTAGVGGVLAKGGQTMGAAPLLVNSLRGTGFAPTAPGLSGLAGQLAARSAGGAATGGATATLVNPEDAGTGAAIGGALPMAFKAAGLAGNTLSDAGQKTAHWFMRSAIKPTLKQLKSGEADVAIKTMLKYGINPTESGVRKLSGMIDNVDDLVSQKIANSTAIVDKAAVASRLGDTRKVFGGSVNPQADLAAIDAVEKNFLNHPNFSGQTMPVQQAQEMKRATYSALQKKYGEMGGAATEAEKSLARGLKEEISTAVPGVAELNAKYSDLVKSMNVSERRALMELNKNPGGLAWLANNPASFLAFMADKSAAFKAYMARALHTTSDAFSANKTNPIVQALRRPLELAAPVLGAQDY